MALRALAALLCVGLVCGAVTAAVAQEPTQSPQALFRDVLLKDTKPASGVARLLRTNAGFVSSTPVFADLTGDGKSDAVVTVENGGAAGAVAAYVLPAEGSESGALRVAFPNQSLYQGHVRTSGPAVTAIDPIYARGDDRCCARPPPPRNQALVRRSGPTLTVIDPIYGRGDDVCCARHATERDYAWDASLKTFTRRATRTVTIGPTAARSRSRG